MTIKQQGGIFGRNPTFNDVTSSKSVVDNITIDGNTISTTNTNGALVLEPNGSAPVTINATQPRVRLIDTDASGTPEAEVSASGGDLILTADRDNEKSDTLIRFLIDGGEKWQINSTGNLVVSNSGNGIDFSATSGTGTSELFDDYEEGTWSPTYDDTGGTGSYTQDVSRGLYTKVGNKVTVHFEVRTDAVSGATGDAIITGLPFTPSGTNYNETGVGSVAALTIQGFTTQAPTACVASTSGNIELLYDNGGVTTNLPAANLATGANSNRLRGTVTYLIT